MVSINCWIDNESVVLRLTSVSITILNQDRPYCEIMSLRNYEQSNETLSIYFEKKPIHLRFATSNVRNAVRTMIFVKASCYRRVIQNVNYKILEDIKFLDHTLALQLGLEVIEHVDPKDDNAKFIETLRSNQLLFDTFIYMKLPLEHFYKLFISSNYHDFKNDMNELDKVLKKHVEDTFKVNGIHQVNMRSLLIVGEKLNVHYEKPIEHKINYEIDLSFLYQLENRCNVREIQIPIAINGLPTKIEKRPKNVVFLTESFAFDKKDFYALIEVYKLSYRSTVFGTKEYGMQDTIRKKTIEFTTKFVDVIRCKYGEEALKYISRFLIK